VAEALADLDGLESTWASERLYSDGSRVVLAGRTNAGKSSLFNALLKQERAIVSDIHGTTRDWLESWADFGGIPVRLFDTAGLRKTGDSIEAEGVERSRSLALDADLVLYLVDGTAGIDANDRQFLERTGGDFPPCILVWNKADRAEALPVPQENETLPAVRAVSAKTGAGIAELVGTAVRLLLGPTGQIREASLGSERQKNAVHTARSFLANALKASQEGFPMDAVSQDLEDALSALGEITGEVTSADILDTVFSGFCVGK